MDHVEAGGGAGKVHAASRDEPYANRRSYHDPTGHSLGRTKDEWDEIASKLGSGRSGQAVRNQIRKFRKRGRDEDEPDSQPWTDDENAKLESIIQTDGPGEWATKARLLGTGRSGTCVALRYRKKKKGIIDTLIINIDSATFAEKQEDRRKKKEEEEVILQFCIKQRGNLY